MKLLVQFDSSGQEARLMAELSKDPLMCQIFRDGKDFHGYTGSRLGGMSYEHFMREYQQSNPVVSGEHGLRYQGKFTNLSCQYRIGAKKLRTKARVDYGMKVSLDTSKEWLNIYNHTYVGVPQYQNRAIEIARQRGYAETLAGRRFYISYWDVDHEWGSGQSAINHPIQGSGADMKYLAKAMIKRHFKWLRWNFDLHDGLWYVAEHCRNLDSKILSVRAMLNELPYAKAWGWTPTIPFLWDATVGINWGEMRNVK